MRAFNQTTEDEIERRRQILSEMFAQVGPRVEVEPPFYCDYGENIHVGDGLFMNFDCVILDCARVDIGRNAFIGPGVHIYAAYHPTDPTTRNSGMELAAPVKIGDDCWIGGHVTICPGVTIGDGTTLGTGSVVVKDVPARILAAGNPCRVIRKL